MDKKFDLKMNEDSIRKSFSRELKKIVKKGENGYYIPNYNIGKAKVYLEDE